MSTGSRLGLSVAAALCILPVRAEQTLCQAGEHIVFACHVGAKSVSLCRAREGPPRLTYRFGRQDRVELTFPGPGERADFRAASSVLYGGGISTLTFSRGEFEYQLYSRIGRADSDGTQAAREPEFEDGLVVSRGGKPIRRMVCDDGGEGFREDLRRLPGIR